MLHFTALTYFISVNPNNQRLFSIQGTKSAALWTRLYLHVSSEAEDSNELPSSEEDQDLVDFNPELSIKQNIVTSRKTISQIIKDKKKQTQLTLQWWGTNRSGSPSTHAT